MQSNRNFNRPISGGAFGGVKRNDGRMYDKEIIEVVTGANDASDCGVKLLDMIRRKRMSTPNSKRSCMLPLSIRERAQELIKTSSVIPPEKASLNLSKYFNMNENTETGIFIFCVGADNLRRINVQRYNQNGYNTCELFTVSDIRRSNINFSDVPERITLPIICCETMPDAHLRMIVSMYRLTTQLLRNAKHDILLSSRMFGTEMTMKQIEYHLNTYLPEQVTWALVRNFEGYGLEEDNWQRTSFVQLLVIAITLRIQDRMTDIPSLKKTTLMCAMAAKIISQVSNPVELGIPLAAILRWILGRGCYDCALRTCLDHVTPVSLSVLPSGFNISIESVDADLDITPMVLDHESGIANEIAWDPIQGGLSHSWALESAGKAVFPVAALSSHTVMVGKANSSEIVIRCQDTDRDICEMRLDPRQYMILAKALDFVLQTLKSFIQTGTYVGASTWCSINGINPNGYSIDMACLISCLFDMSHDHGNVGKGFLILGSMLAIRRLINIDIRFFEKLPHKQWGDEICRRVFFCNTDLKILSLCYLIREVTLAKGWQWPLREYDAFVCRLEFLDDDTSDDDDDTDLDGKDLEQHSKFGSNGNISPEYDDLQKKGDEFEVFVDDRQIDHHSSERVTSSDVPYDTSVTKSSMNPNAPVFQSVQYATPSNGNIMANRNMLFPLPQRDNTSEPSVISHNYLTIPPPIPVPMNYIPVAQNNYMHWNQINGIAPTNGALHGSLPTTHGMTNGITSFNGYPIPSVSNTGIYYFPHQSDNRSYPITYITHPSSQSAYMCSSNSAMYNTHM